MQQLEQIIGDHPFLKGMDKEFLEVLAGCGQNVTFKPGAYIFREGEAADYFYLLRQGRVSLEIDVPDHEAILVQTLNDGEIIGASWIVPPYRWSWDARALSTIRAVALDAVCLRGKCDADHDFGYELMKRFTPAVSRRLQAARLQLFDMYSTQR
jgi:CRP/FNR family cyclic AMP-dependent transcriptional regulator